MNPGAGVEVEYTPASELRRPWKLARAMLRDLLASRGLAWRLLLRNLRAAYRQAVLGYLWVFLPALVTTLVFVLLRSEGVLGIGETPVPYPAFVLLGTVLWQVFVDGVNAPVRMVLTSRSMLARVNFPREALILAAGGEVLVNAVARLLLVAVALAYYRLDLHLALLLAPCGLLCLLGLGLLLGVLITPIAVLYQDAERGLGVALSLWFFVTPVVYPAPAGGLAGAITGLNPVAPLLIATRDWVLVGATTAWPSFLVVAGGIGALLLVGWLIYRLAMPIIIERIGGS